MRRWWSCTTRVYVFCCGLVLLVLIYRDLPPTVEVTDRTPGILVARLGGGPNWFLDHRGNVHLDPRCDGLWRRDALMPAHVAHCIRSARRSPYIVSALVRREVRELVEAAHQEKVAPNHLGSEGWPRQRPPAYVAFIRATRTGRYHPFSLYEGSPRYLGAGRGPATRKLVHWMQKTECWFRPREDGLPLECDE